VIEEDQGIPLAVHEVVGRTFPINILASPALKMTLKGNP